MASLTFDMAPACDPGDPDGTEIGDDPIGGCPDSEGGIMFGKGESLASRKPELLPTTALVLTTSHLVLLVNRDEALSHRPVGKGFYLCLPLVNNSGCS